MLRGVAKDLWVDEAPLRFLGAEIGTRMSVIRLGDGGLWLHSPVALSDPLRAALDAIGPVRFVVAPNRMHHLHVGDYASAYPEAELHGAPGLADKRPDLAFDFVLGDAAPPGWAGQIEQVAFGGMPIANEIDFYHRASRTLLVSDIAFHIGAEAPPLTRLGFRLLRAYGRFGPSLTERLLLIRDRAAARASLDRILAWDFERAIVCHGSVVEHDARAQLEQNYAWL